MLEWCLPDLFYSTVTWRTYLMSTRHPSAYLVVKAPWLFPQIFGGPEVLQALGLAQWLHCCLHV